MHIRLPKRSSDTLLPARHRIASPSAPMRVAACRASTPKVASRHMDVGSAGALLATLRDALARGLALEDGASRYYVESREPIEARTQGRIADRQ